VVTRHEPGSNARAAGKAAGVPVQAGMAKTARLATATKTRKKLSCFTRFSDA